MDGIADRGVDVNVTETTVARLNNLIVKGRATLATHRVTPGVAGDYARHRALYRVEESGPSFLRHLLGDAHTYSRQFEDRVLMGRRGDAEGGIGILWAVLQDVEGGYLTNFRILISAEIFDDFLDMASHLLEAGNKDPAAMLTGAVLEDGLRQILANHGIDSDRRDGLARLNQKCADANIYNRLVHHQVQVWTEIRNGRDHGNFDQYQLADVADMHKGVTTFLVNQLA